MKLFGLRKSTEREIAMKMRNRVDVIFPLIRNKVRYRAAIPMTWRRKVKKIKLWKHEVVGKTSPVSIVLYRHGRKYDIEMRWAAGGPTIVLCFSKKPNKVALDKYVSACSQSSWSEFLRSVLENLGVGSVIKTTTVV